MAETGDRSRIRRLKYWIAGLTLLPGLVLVAAGFGSAAVGYALGGSVILLNLLGTERTVLAFVDGGGGSRFLGIALYVLKLGLTAAVIAAAFLTGIVSPLAFMFGVTTLLVALLFDILVFPRNKRDNENTEGY